MTQVSANVVEDLLIRSQESWVLVLPLPLTTCVTLDSHFNSLSLTFLIYQVGLITLFQGGFRAR